MNKMLRRNRLENFSSVYRFSGIESLKSYLLLNEPLRELKNCLREGQVLSKSIGDRPKGATLDVGEMRRWEEDKKNLLVDVIPRIKTAVKEMNESVAAMKDAEKKELQIKELVDEALEEVKKAETYLKNDPGVRSAIMTGAYKLGKGK